MRPVGAKAGRKGTVRVGGHRSQVVLETGRGAVRAVVRTVGDQAGLINDFTDHLRDYIQINTRKSDQPLKVPPTLKVPRTSNSSCKQPIVV